MPYARKSCIPRANTTQIEMTELTSGRNCSLRGVPHTPWNQTLTVRAKPLRDRRNLDSRERYRCFVAQAIEEQGATNLETKRCTHNSPHIGPALEVP